jgi:hypothetical protein
VTLLPLDGDPREILLEGGEALGELGGQLIAEAVEERADLRHLGGPLAAVDAQQPSTRPIIHSSTRRFSPKPGQMKRPRSSVRNQFTWKTAGGRSSSWPMRSQWPK